jgi:oligoribonuclease NrnB/cAMP/cGMP phosphodiesterase (DHH superfamily)
MSIYAVISHSSDIDGVASASFLRIKYNIPLKNIFFSDYSVESIESAYSEIKKLIRHGVLLFVADIGMNKKLVKSLKNMIVEINKWDGSVIWFDHHVWDRKDILEVANLCRIAAVGENSRYCATEITRKYLHLDTPFAKKLARIVHYSDFNLKPKNKEYMNLIKIYALALTKYNMLPYKKRTDELREVVEVISSGNFTNKKLENDAYLFERENTERIKNMLGDVLTIGRDIAVGFAYGVQSTQACQALIEKTGADIGMYVNPKNRKGHMRSIRADCSILANALGGGGHPHASGFEVSKKYGKLDIKKNRNIFVKDVEKIAKELYKHAIS